MKFENTSVSIYLLSKLKFISITLKKINKSDVDVQDLSHKL